MDRPLKYPSTPHWPQSESVHRDDSYHQNPFYFLDKEVVITEKLDGGNTSLFDGEVYARSNQAPSHAGWMAMVRKHHAWKSVQYPRQIFYGEDIYGIHSLEYNAVKEDETYRLFAVYQFGYFCSWEAVETWAQALEIKTVPVIFRGKFTSINEITDYFRQELKKPSAIGSQKEGFVMRIADPFDYAEFDKNVCKYVRKNHVQTDEHWTRNWQPCALLK